MVWLYIIAGESIKANFILIEQDIQFSPVYFATILNIINDNIIHTFLKYFSGKEAHIKTRR